MAQFEEAVEKTLALEGGFVQDAADRGGTTKFGISQRAYPELDVANLTVEHARAIYRRDYWLPRYADIESQRVANFLFDMGVHSGVGTAVRILQHALRALGQNVSVDGRFGPATLRATNVVSEDRLMRELKVQRIAYLVRFILRQPEQERFLIGWLRRIESFH